MTNVQRPIARVQHNLESPASAELKPATMAAGPPRRRWPWIVLTVVVLIVAGAVGWSVYSHAAVSGGASGRAGTATSRPSPVVVSAARKGDMPLYLTGLGNVAPFNTATVRARVDGNIDQINFTEGQIVKEGDPLCEIDPRPFQVQLETAQGQLARDEAALHNAQLNVKRDTEAKDAISAQQLSTDTATAEQAAANVKIDQASIDSAKLQLSYCHITAPISGRIGLRLVDKGNLVHASDTTGIAVITQLQPISLLFTLPEDSLQRVQKRMQAGALPVDAYDRDLTSKLSSGSLSALDNQIDPNSGTFKLKATFANEDSSLFPNQFVNARLLIDTRREAIIIPSAAVQQSPDDMFVYVVKDDPAAEGDSNGPKHGAVSIQKVTLGPTEGDSIVIADGLASGDIVVTDGVDKLQDKSKVTYMLGPEPGNSTQPGGHGAGSGAIVNGGSQHRHRQGGAEATTKPAE